MGGGASPHVPPPTPSCGRKLDGDVVGDDKFAFEKSCQTAIHLEDAIIFDSCSDESVMVEDDVDTATNIGYMIFQSFCVQKTSNY